MEIPACTFPLFRRPEKARMRLSIIGAVAFIVLPASGQNITTVTGFHPVSDSDPFAKKDALVVVSSAAKVVNVGGAQATVTIGCFSPNAIASLWGSFLGQPTLPILAVKVDLTGANLDIETHPGNALPNGHGGYTQAQVQSVRMRVRFDEENPFEPGTSSITAHHVEFSYSDLDRVLSTQKLLIGVPSGGRSVNLRLNLDDAQLKSAIQGCVNVKQQILTEQKAKEAKEAEVPDPIRSLEGVVTDPFNRPVIGAVVQFKEMQLKQWKTLQLRKFITTEGGKYHFDVTLQPDVTYEIMATFNGMSFERRLFTFPKTGKTLTYDLKMRRE